MASGNGGVPTEAQMILAPVQQAAQAAADAAVALREASQNTSGGFAEANKTVQVPKSLDQLPLLGTKTIGPILHFLSGSDFVLLTQVTTQIWMMRRNIQRSP